MCVCVWERECENIDIKDKIFFECSSSRNLRRLVLLSLALISAFFFSSLSFYFSRCLPSFLLLDIQDVLHNSLCNDRICRISRWFFLNFKEKNHIDSLNWGRICSKFLVEFLVKIKHSRGEPLCIHMLSFTIHA